MKLSQKQITILRYVHENDKITKRMAVQLIGEISEHNADKHVGELLSRMVHHRALKRIKNGLFKLGDGMESGEIEILGLFKE